MPKPERDLIFSSGLALLRKAGIADRSARSFLAKLCKDHGDEATLAVVKRACDLGPVDPASWLRQAAAKGKNGKTYEIDGKRYPVGDKQRVRWLSDAELRDGAWSGYTSPSGEMGLKPGGRWVG